MLKTLHRGLWLVAGIFFLLTGLLGLMLPLIPQVPFFLAALFCFMRCSSRFRRWMEKQEWFNRLKEKFHHKSRP